MKTIDLSHTISSETPVFPGDESPIITPIATIEDDGFASLRMSFSSHTGTHIDAPAHILLHSRTLDRIPLDSFIGHGSVIDLTKAGNAEIAVSTLKPYENLFKNSEYILLRTGWSRFWGQETYLKDFPVLSIEAALWVHSFQLKGLGVDTISVDAVNSESLPIHKILLERSMIVENLTDLDKLPTTGFIFSCFPLKLEKADASPVRAVAILL
jgi:arylformamidase